MLWQSLHVSDEDEDDSTWWMKCLVKLYMTKTHSMDLTKHVMKGDSQVGESNVEYSQVYIVYLLSWILHTCTTKSFFKIWSACFLFCAWVQMCKNMLDNDVIYNDIDNISAKPFNVKLS